MRKALCLASQSVLIPRKLAIKYGICVSWDSVRRQGCVKEIETGLEFLAKEDELFLLDHTPGGVRYAGRVPALATDRYLNVSEEVEFRTLRTRIGLIAIQITGPGGTSLRGERYPPKYGGPENQTNEEFNEFAESSISSEPVER